MQNHRYESSHTHTQRCQFDVTSPNGVLLFREASKTIVSYGERILSLTDIPSDKIYPLKYPPGLAALCRGHRALRHVMHSALSLYSPLVCSFWLYACMYAYLPVVSIRDYSYTLRTIPLCV